MSDNAGEHNTRVLMDRIDRILKDEDLDPFKPPETQHSQRVRLTRLFLDWGQESLADSDRWIAIWLAEFGAPERAEDIRKGRHWAWIRERSKNDRVPGLDAS
jgi:hypothetical protein